MGAIFKMKVSDIIKYAYEFWIEGEGFFIEEDLKAYQKEELFSLSPYQLITRIQTLKYKSYLITLNIKFSKKLHLIPNCYHIFSTNWRFCLLNSEKWVYNANYVSTENIMTFSSFENTIEYIDTNKIKIDKELKRAKNGHSK